MTRRLVIYGGIAVLCSSFVLHPSSLLRGQEPKQEEPKKDEPKKDEPKKEINMKVDTDGLADRIVEIPVQASGYRNLQSVGATVYYIRQGAKDSKPAFQMYDLSIQQYATNDSPASGRKPQSPHEVAKLTPVRECCCRAVYLALSGYDVSRVCAAQPRGCFRNEIGRAVEVGRRR